MERAVLRWDMSATNDITSDNVAHGVTNITPTEIKIIPNF
jgi:hypothetical protein